MTIAIHISANSYSDRWVEYCQENGIAYRAVNCYSNSIVQQLEGCAALLWHHHQSNPKDILFAKQLLFSLEQTGMKVFPNFNTGWHFDDKLGQRYLMEKAGIPMAPTYIFYTRKEALDWVNKTTFPKVFKLRGGSSSSNVKIVDNKKAAIKLINTAFSKGFSKYRAYDNLKERLRKYRIGKMNFMDMIKGVVRLAVSPAYSKIGGKEIGYIYFQDFIPGNEHDIRVVVIGNKAYAIKRMTRENDFRASGSGNILYQKEFIDEVTLQLSFSIAAKLKTQCLAFDYVYENDNPILLEISYGFKADAYDECPGYWDDKLQWHTEKFDPCGWMIEDIIKSVNDAEEKRC